MLRNAFWHTTIRVMHPSVSFFVFADNEKCRFGGSMCLYVMESLTACIFHRGYFYNRGVRARYFCSDYFHYRVSFLDSYCQKMCNGYFTFNITGAYNTIPFDVECVGSPNSIIVSNCKKVNKLVYKKLEISTRGGTIVNQ